ncbi:SHOCT domain-containing protein [Streptomyces sp. NPDC020801]|uniref:SHOCT domain-containing protein n=1 Tax=unclassified Streptomyces TaxID=2593676 RepID=UPI0037A8C4AF
MTAMMYWNGGGWAWMAFMPLVWIALIGLAVWAVVRLTQRPGGHDSSPGRERSTSWESPEEILDRRFASGEIDAEAYTEARERLAAHKPRQR